MYGLLSDLNRCLRLSVKTMKRALSHRWLDGRFELYNATVEHDGIAAVVPPQDWRWTSLATANPRPSASSRANRDWQYVCTFLGPI